MNLIKEKIKEEWPSSVKNLAGAWTNLPTLEEIRSIKETDTEREEL